MVGGGRTGAPLDPFEQGLDSGAEVMCETASVSQAFAGYSRMTGLPSP